MFENWYIIEDTGTCNREYTIPMIKKHYLKTLPRGTKKCYTLVVDDIVCGLAIFGRPISNTYDNSEVLELSRFYLNPEMPTNTGSWFMSKCIKQLKKYTEYKKVITYADPRRKHKGILYKASNFEFVGEQKYKGQALKFMGKLFHVRICYQRTKDGKYTKTAMLIRQGRKKGLVKNVSLPKKLVFQYNLR